MVIFGEKIIRIGLSLCLKVIPVWYRCPVSVFLRFHPSCHHPDYDVISVLLRNT